MPFKIEKLAFSPQKEYTTSGSFAGSLPQPDNKTQHTKVANNITDIFLPNLHFLLC